MKLICEVTYKDDRVDKFEVLDFPYFQSRFFVVRLKDHKVKYISDDTIMEIETYWKVK